MKAIGLLVGILGWLLAVMSLTFASPFAQLLTAALGFVVAMVGALGIVNRAHLKNAIWKR